MKLKGLVAIIVAVSMLALVSPVRSQTDAPPPTAPPAGDQMQEGAKGTTDEMKKEKKAAKKSGKKHKKTAKNKAKTEEQGAKDSIDKQTETMKNEGGAVKEEVTKP